MKVPTERVVGAEDIAAPHDPRLVELHGYWNGKRGTRAMPARTDIDPADFRKLLPNVILCNIDASGTPTTLRLVGGEIVQFLGQNNTGREAGIGLEPHEAARMRDLLQTVARERAPKFRVGQVWWRELDRFRAFEVCFLPLAPDGEAVNMVLFSIVFGE
jgi:hypothetical protein